MDRIKSQCPPHRCADGLVVSVQAGAYLYSTPRADKGPYTHVELGFPSQVPPDYILEYAEEPDNPTGTVYPYTPVELVYRWFAEHGGAIAM